MEVRIYTDDGQEHLVPAGIVAIADQWKLDAAETLAFSRMLETVKAKVYQKKYAELKARGFVGISSEGGNASSRLIYRMWDSYVMARVISSASTTIPMVTASAQEFAIGYANFGLGYEYTLQDLRNALKGGIDLDSALALQLRRGIELSLDQAMAVGIPEIKTTGLINNINVPIGTFPTGNWTASTTAAQMLADLNYGVQLIITSTLEIWAPDTLLLPTAMFQLANNTIIGAEFSKTVLKAFLENSPYITNIDQWTKLNTANPSGGRRVMFYKRDDEAMQGEIGQEFEQFPAQLEGFNTRVFCQARAAGVVFRHPLAALYVDNG